MRWSQLRKMFWLLMSAPRRGFVSGTQTRRRRGLSRLAPFAVTPFRRREESLREARASVKELLAVHVVEGEADLDEPARRNRGAKRAQRGAAATVLDLRIAWLRLSSDTRGAPERNRRGAGLERRQLLG